MGKVGGDSDTLLRRLDGSRSLHVNGDETRKIVGRGVHNGGNINRVTHG